jgi:hypothetical protein
MGSPTWGRDSYIHGCRANKFDDGMRPEEEGWEKNRCPEKIGIF